MDKKNREIAKSIQDEANKSDGARLTGTGLYMGGALVVAIAGAVIVL
jgi:hypothetical protein